jgi:hypothetical protein
MYFGRKTILLFIFFSFMSVGWGQQCTAGNCIEGYGNYIYEDGANMPIYFEPSS